VLPAIMVPIGQADCRCDCHCHDARL